MAYHQLYLYGSVLWVIFISCLLVYFVDDIIKLTQKKQTPRGKGAANRAGGARKTKQQIVQKQVIRQQQQQKRSKLSIPKVNT